MRNLLNQLRGWIRILWKLFVGAAVITAIVGVGLRLLEPSSTTLQVIEPLVNAAAIITGMLAAWGFFDRGYLRRKQLLQLVRNQVSDVAKSAISQLNAEGYLSNGSLKGVDFRDAKLAGVDLKATNRNDQTSAANLENANLTEADLSGADMQRIVLRGANLELTNLSYAKLMNADLREARFFLTNLIGADLRKADLTEATFAGVVCDETTVLPDGSLWGDTVDWVRFGAVDKHPEYAQSLSADTFKDNDALQYENQRQREHDLKLLERLWKKMNSRNIIRLDDDTQYRILESEFYAENFRRYLYERQEYSELRFISPVVEAQVQLYDEALAEFIQQLFQSAGVEDFHGKPTIRPDYKLPRINRETQKYKEREWDKTVDKLLELRRVHDTLVAFLKKHFPEFDFFGDSSSGK